MVIILSVCLLPSYSCYIPCLFVESQVPLSFCADLNGCIVWISSKTLCLKVLATFADNHNVKAELLVHMKL